MDVQGRNALLENFQLDEIHADARVTPALKRPAEHPPESPNPLKFWRAEMPSGVHRIPGQNTICSNGDRFIEDVESSNEGLLDRNKQPIAIHRGTVAPLPRRPPALSALILDQPEGSSSSGSEPLTIPVWSTWDTTFTSPEKEVDSRPAGSSSRVIPASPSILPTSTSTHEAANLTGVSSSRLSAAQPGSLLHQDTAPTLPSAPANTLLKTVSNPSSRASPEDVGGFTATYPSHTSTGRSPAALNPSNTHARYRDKAEASDHTVPELCIPDPRKAVPAPVEVDMSQHKLSGLREADTSHFVPNPYQDDGSLYLISASDEAVTQRFFPAPRKSHATSLAPVPGPQSSHGEGHVSRLNMVPGVERDDLPSIRVGSVARKIEAHAAGFGPVHGPQPSHGGMGRANMNSIRAESVTQRWENPAHLYTGQPNQQPSQNDFGGGNYFQPDFTYPGNSRTSEHLNQIGAAPHESRQFDEDITMGSAMGAIDLFPRVAYQQTTIPADPRARPTPEHSMPQSSLSNTMVHGSETQHQHQNPFASVVDSGRAHVAPLSKTESHSRDGAAARDIRRDVGVSASNNPFLQRRDGEARVQQNKITRTIPPHPPSSDDRLYHPQGTLDAGRSTRESSRSACLPSSNNVHNEMGSSANIPPSDATLDNGDISALLSEHRLLRGFEHYAKKLNAAQESLQAQMNDLSLDIKQRNKTFDAHAKAVSLALSKSGKKRRASSQASSPAKRARKNFELPVTSSSGRKDEDEEVQEPTIEAFAVVDNFRGHTSWIPLLEAVRDVFKALLKISDYKPKEFEKLPEPLDDEEFEIYASIETGNMVSVDKFRVDFTRPWKKDDFNASAREVFINHFLEKVKSGAILERYGIKPNYVTWKVVGAAIDQHVVRYVRGLYNDWYNGVSLGSEYERRKRAAMANRKSTLLWNRFTICRDRKALNHHAPLFVSLTRGCMSGDETEPEEGPEKAPKRYLIVKPVWRSLEFTIFLHALDRKYREAWRSPGGGRRATPGNPPRICKESSLSHLGVVPKGLHRNCYDAKWLKSIKSWQRENLMIIDEDYDFSIHDIDDDL
ncbi:hypothetical protein CONPUDRAFT_156973 [Coniophora puteana RWD-64-598 SS2]|uniref:Uncharacterized protein n=1 Tax=Coniophora puteana (strain RWD-64-598) TaxID=741705 RepID=A0A5M3MEU6_CONPW|nr:uncharacterized protein CONPUDRAFT_156973 [Coniophora puteana RWD-64-598 SS2]EIW77789.1 hypothetical protein CONPUDRAFT_156973 [Coniophora puteana RWD-64-598 SS2]